MVTKMASEMAEQPAVIAALAADWAALTGSVASIRPAEPASTVFVGRGSSDNAAVLGRYVAELASGRPASLAAPSLTTRYNGRVDYTGTLVVALSQSGETPEIVTCAERMAAAGARVVAITNRRGSSLSRAADVTLCVDAGPELAVPATKTVTGQMFAVLAVAAALGPSPLTDDGLKRLPAALQDVTGDDSSVRDLLGRWGSFDRMLVGGRGLLYPAALESALKIKETCRLGAEGYSLADLLHGPISAMDGRTPALLFDGGGPTSGDVAEVAERLRGKGGPVAICSAAPGADLSLPGGLDEAAQVLAATVRGQQVALRLALARGLDPDAPAGLSKVTVTV